MSSGNTQQVFNRDDAIEVVRLQPNIGAEIYGLDLSGPYTPELRDKVLALLLEHQVIFFRDQSLNSEQQQELGKLFGELGADSVDGVRTVQTMKAGSYYGTRWHADATYREQPFFISILRSIVAPELGGDTVFSSGVSAYRSLPEELKERIADLNAIHRPYSKAHLMLADDARREQYLRDFPGAVHPVVTSHPYTGKKVLYVNETFTQEIVDLPKAEGEQLLRELTTEFHKPEHQVRFKWQPGSIAIWDNRAVQHYGVPDYGIQDRHLERVVVKGDRPVR